MSDDQTVARAREKLASGRMRLGAMVESERWDEVAAIARELARLEREIALATSGPGTKPAGRRVFVRG